MFNIEAVFNEIRAELAHQDKAWGPEHDKGHLDHEWTAILTHRVGKFFEAVESDGNRRRRLVQVAAVAVSAIRAMEARS